MAEGDLSVSVTKGAQDRTGVYEVWTVKVQVEGASGARADYGAGHSGLHGRIARVRFASQFPTFAHGYQKALSSRPWELPDPTPNFGHAISRGDAGDVTTTLYLEDGGGAGSDVNVVVARVGDEPRASGVEITDGLTWTVLTRCP